jgi:hypothetical protein
VEVFMVEIKILGMICGDCLKVEKVVTDALIELRIEDALVESVCEKAVLDYGLQAEKTPGLLIDGFLAWAGSIPTKEKVMELIQKASTPTVI